jgi:hypothetical protein
MNAITIAGLPPLLGFLAKEQLKASYPVRPAGFPSSTP